ncbi:MAG: hypothetical protein HYZ72_16285 [Deltaproteobacteria bacterium]|nr:hypothetical protein [Deltaproteobacteria bacterium]
MLVIGPIVAVVSLIILLTVPLQRWLAKRRGPRMTASQVAATIQNFLDGTSGSWDWDDFISVPIGDPELDAIRTRCARLDDEYPPEVPGRYCGDAGLDVMREFVRALGSPDG